MNHMYKHIKHMTEQLYKYRHVKYLQEEARYQRGWFR